MEKHIGETIKNGITAVLKGTREVAVGVVDVVSATVVKALEGVNDVQVAASSVVVGAISIVITTSGRAGGLVNREPLEAVGKPWVT
jgi:hypothetical protein